MATSRYKAVFSDVGGVIATNGWDTPLRATMVEHFRLDQKEVDSRHQLMFDSFERGNLTFDEYLNWTVFYEPRPFTVEEVRQWVFDQARMLPGTYDLYKKVKAKNGIKLALISNEGGGLTEDRVRRFRLGELADYMLFSNTVGMRKPDPGIWKLALVLAQVSMNESIYIDDRKMFVDFAAHLGFTAYQHVSAAETEKYLTSLGLSTQ
ncbi:MAG: HAD hydrolase-like protein [Bryobacteraceae bacterium]